MVNIKMKKTIIFVLFAVSLVINGCDRIEEHRSSQVQQQIDKNVNLETNIVSVVNKVILQTSMGDIVIELNPEKATLAVKNFLGYVESGFYDGTIFHRVIEGFMIQAGGLDENLNQKNTNPPIKNEASNGLKNDRGTIAMGQLPKNPDSATSHFFINHVDNDGLNYAGRANPGYTVFGKVIEGMDVVDKIAAVKVTIRKGMEAVPVNTVKIISVKVVSE